MRRRIVYPLTVLGMVASTTAIASPAMAHGYISSPPSRQALCAAGTVTDCGPIQYEPQSVEGAKGLRECNGGNDTFAVLNDVSRAWPTTTVGSSVTFNWVLTARHRTTDWVYYVDGTQVARFDGRNEQPAGALSHEVDLRGYEGNHTVLAVWTIADTSRAFYSCVDLNIRGGGVSSAPVDTSPETGQEKPKDKPNTQPDSAPPRKQEQEQPIEQESPPRDTEHTTVLTGSTEWAPQVGYTTGQVVTYQGKSYQCRQSHTSLRSWEPSVYTLALWLPL